MYDEIDFMGIRLSSYCNLDCKYCYQYSAAKEKHNLFKDYNALNKFLIKLPLAENLKFFLSGGEPSLYIDEVRKACKQIRKVMRYKDTNIHFSVYTNGTNLQGILDLMNEGLLDSFYCALSWDGLHTTKSRLVKNKKYTDEFFNKNIELLGKQCKKYREDINIRTAATRDTIGELADNYKYVLDHGCTRWEYYIVNDESAFRDEEYLDLIKDQLRKIYIMARDNNIADSLCNLENMLYMYFDEPDDYIKQRFITCRHLGNTLFVNPTGEIFPCALSDNITKVYDGIKFGDIYNGFNKDVMQSFCNDYNTPPSCGMIYKGKPCKTLHCFECAVTCKHCNGSLNKKSFNQCELRHIEYDLFKEIFIDSGYKFSDEIMNKYKNTHFENLLYNTKLNPDLPYKK